MIEMYSEVDTAADGGGNDDADGDDDDKDVGGDDDEDVGGDDDDDYNAADGGGNEDGGDGEKTITIDCSKEFSKHWLLEDTCKLE